MTTISAKTILRSRNLAAPEHVVSTILCRYPRFIHAELMTHRVFSRNAASSRAIPVRKMLNDLAENPVFPVHWGKNQKGMQATDELDGLALADAKFEWGMAFSYALKSAERLEMIGVHKALVNRILEPFCHITTLITATEWENFIELRDHSDAEPHIAMLAREIKTCLADGQIQDLEPGDWHTPFAIPNDEGYDSERLTIENRIKLSVARCASTSYKTVDGFDMTLDRAIALHDKLVSSKPIHASPAEHVCQADDVKWIPNPNGITRDMVQTWQHPEQHANFNGFRQYRHMLPVAA